MNIHTKKDNIDRDMLQICNIHRNNEHQLQ